MNQRKRGARLPSGGGQSRDRSTAAGVPTKDSEPAEAVQEPWTVSEVRINNHRRGFELVIGSREYFFPFPCVHPEPTPENRVVEAGPDPEIGCHGFTYRLEDGDEGTVHLDAVREYHRDPDYLREAHLYRMTLEAQQRVEESPLSTRELIRRMNTSASQFYRLMDQTNVTKSVDQMIALLWVLGCEVRLEFVDPEPRS